LLSGNRNIKSTKNPQIQTQALNEKNARASHNFQEREQLLFQRNKIKKYEKKRTTTLQKSKYHQQSQQNLKGTTSLQGNRTHPK